jgi:hypothetical protein
VLQGLEGGSDAIVRALTAAEERARRVLIEELGEEASRFSITVRADYDEHGVLRLVVDVEASRPRCSWVDKTVARAVREARRAFEEVLVGLHGGSRGP